MQITGRILGQSIKQRASFAPAIFSENGDTIGDVWLSDQNQSFLNVLFTYIIGSLSSEDAAKRIAEIDIQRLRSITQSYPDKFNPKLFGDLNTHNRGIEAIKREKTYRSQ